MTYARGSNKQRVQSKVSFNPPNDGGSINEQSNEMRIQCFESRRPQGGYDDSGDVLIALTGTFMYAELQHTVSDCE